MLAQVEKYSKQAIALCGQVQRMTMYLETLGVISQPSTPLLDALVTVIEGLIDASVALMEFRHKSKTSTCMLVVLAGQDLLTTQQSA